MLITKCLLIIFYFSILFYCIQKSGEDWHFAVAKKEINSFTIEYALKNPCTSDDGDAVVVSPLTATFLRLYRPFQVQNWILDIEFIPTNIFECDSWLFKQPPITLWSSAIATKVYIYIYIYRERERERESI